MVAKRHFRLIRSRNAGLIISLVAILVLALGVWAWHSHNKKISSASSANKVTGSQNAAAASQNPPKTPISSSGIAQGSATDNHGTKATTTSPAQWTSSTSGAITVKQPAANTTFKSGSILSGSSTLGQIQYRLIDNQVGQIAEGPVSVVGGSFSATLQFSAHASSGELDVFSYDPGNPGAEINEIKVPINFK